MATRNPVKRDKGPIVAEGGVGLGANVWMFRNAGVPGGGTTGTGAGWAGPGSICSDLTGKKLYINTNTKASPTWTVVGTQT